MANRIRFSYGFRPGGLQVRKVSQCGDRKLGHHRYSEKGSNSFQFLVTAYSSPSLLSIGSRANMSRTLALAISFLLGLAVAQTPGNSPEVHPKLQTVSTHNPFLFFHSASLEVEDVECSLDLMPSLLDQIYRNEKLRLTPSFRPVAMYQPRRMRSTEQCRRPR
jgi:hypothetical protein